MQACVIGVNQFLCLSQEQQEEIKNRKNLTFFIRIKPNRRVKFDRFYNTTVKPFARKHFKTKL